MAIRKYNPSKDLALSPATKLILWTIENPDRAIEVGTTIAVIGGIVWLFGMLLKR